MTREDLETFVRGLSDIDLVAVRGFVNKELRQRIEVRGAAVPSEGK